MAITRFDGEYQFLSNMYPTIVTVDGEMYPSSEHAYQAMKSLDRNDRIAISVCRSPKEAKQAGKYLPLRPDWEQIKTDIMYKVVRAKFEDPELADKLRNTGTEELIEGNEWGDTFWGVCKGSGRNELGKILMKVRKEIG